MAGDRKPKPANAGMRPLAAGTPGLDEDLYRAVIETSADGFWIVDGEGRILEVNEAYIRRSGYSRSELLSMRIGQLEAREDPAETAAHIRNIIREGSDLFETLHRAKDGTVWQVEVNASYWPIEGGRFFGFLRDISRRKRSESLLRTRLELSEIAGRGTVDDLLRHALDAAELHTGSSIGFFHFVDDDQETLTLQAWSTNTLNGMCSAAGKGKHYPISKAGVWVDCVPAGKPVIHNDYASLAHRKGTPEGHAPVTREVVVPVLRDGKIVAIAGVGNKTSDYAQEDVEVLQEIASLTLEIVVRKRAEEALRQSEITYRGIIDSLNEAVYILDEHGDVHRREPGRRAMYGCPREELVGRSPATVSAEGRNDLGRVAEHLREAFAGRPQSLESGPGQGRPGLPEGGAPLPGDVPRQAGRRRHRPGHHRAQAQPRRRSGRARRTTAPCSIRPPTGSSCSTSRGTSSTPTGPPTSVSGTRGKNFSPCPSASWTTRLSRPASPRGCA